ncbi:hypothetical protein FRC11_000060 [Ceratobasidium sp. 423]|nr:hypothetical protein FRC11_000060 [Ceratobasidium sp. 423]
MSQRLSMPPPIVPIEPRTTPTMTTPTPATGSQPQQQPHPQASACAREFPPPGVSIAPDDLRDGVLMGICRALAHVDNRALTPRQIVDVAHSAGIIKLGGNTPASTVSTHIRAHLARGTPALLLRHSLHPRPRHSSDAPTTEDRAIGPNADGTSERKKGTAWYLSEAAGFLSPWDRLRIPKPKEPEPDQPARPSPSPAPVAPSPSPSPAPVEPQPQPQRMSSRKRTRTKSWGAAARELGMDGMSPPPEFDDESEAEAHRERKSKVRIRLRLGSVTSRSSSVRPDDAPPSPPQYIDDDSDLEETSQCSNPFPIRNRVFSAPCPQLTRSRRSLSNPSSGPSTPHALVDQDSDVEDGDFHVRMMRNSDSAPSSPRKPAVPIVGIGLGLIFEGSDRSVKVKEESESSMSTPSLSSRASSLAASSLPEDDVWAVKIEEAEDVKAMAIDAPSFDPPDLCEGGLGFDFTTSYEGIELEFAMLDVRSPTILPNAFIRDPDHVDGPESVRLDEVDRIWSDWGDKRAHTRSLRTDPDVPESKGDETHDPESKTDGDERGRRDDTPIAPVTPREKVLAASEEDMSVFMRPSSPATVPCATVRRVLRSRPARVVRTRARA